MHSSKTGYGYKKSVQCIDSPGSRSSSRSMNYTSRYVLIACRECFLYSAIIYQCIKVDDTPKDSEPACDHSHVQQADLAGNPSYGSQRAIISPISILIHPRSSSIANEAANSGATLQEPGMEVERQGLGLGVHSVVDTNEESNPAWKDVENNPLYGHGLEAADELKVDDIPLPKHAATLSCPSTPIKAKQILVTPTTSPAHK